MKQIPKKGFTFVELIVVVIILGILGTVGSISYIGYISGARDSNRLTQLSDIKSGLEVYAVNRSLPLPEKNVSILASGNIIGYQGYVGAGVLNQIGYQDGGKDPLDDSYFTYYTTVDGNSFQLMGFLEESLIAYTPITQSYAAIDYSQRFPTVTGKKLGVMVENTTNTPIQELPDVQNSGLELSTTGTNYRAYYSDENILLEELIQIVPNQSCKRILELGNSIGSGIYKINPTGTSTIQVYCDMEIDGGGWLLAARSISGESGNFSIPDTGNLGDDANIYAFSPEDNGVVFGEELLGVYTTGKSMTEYSISSAEGSIYENDTHILELGGIIGGSFGDGFNSEQGMIFVR